MPSNKTEIILCEGHSEFAYIQELGRLLYRSGSIGYAAAFFPRLIGNGYFNTVSKRYKEEKKKNRKDELLIWVDRDLYIRNDKNCGELYSKKANTLPKFFFSEMNFEDFLILHCPDDIIDQWVCFCKKNNHFTVPMHSQIYEPEFKKIFPNYLKGNLPFELTRERIETMISNLQRYPIRNDFGEYVAFLLKREFWNFFRGSNGSIEFHS